MGRLKVFLLGMLAGLVLTLAVVGCGKGNLGADYCSYGAVSRAQLEGCIDHVDEAYIDSLNTNAARYARGELDDCLTDSGPFCEER